MAIFTEDGDKFAFGGFLGFILGVVLTTPIIIYLVNDGWEKAAIRENVADYYQLSGIFHWKDSDDLRREFEDKLVLEADFKANAEKAKSDRVNN